MIRTVQRLHWRRSSADLLNTRFRTFSPKKKITKKTKTAVSDYFPRPSTRWKKMFVFVCHLLFCFSSYHFGARPVTSLLASSAKRISLAGISSCWTRWYRLVHLPAYSSTRNWTKRKTNPTLATQKKKQQQAKRSSTGRIESKNNKNVMKFSTTWLKPCHGLVLKKKTRKKKIKKNHRTGNRWRWRPVAVGHARGSPASESST